jgi:hypothetical protein
MSTIFSILTYGQRRATPTGVDAFSYHSWSEVGVDVFFSTPI